MDYTVKLITFKVYNEDTEKTINSFIEKRYPTYARISSSIWLVYTNEEVFNVRDNIAALINKGDRILVVEMDNITWGTYGVSKDITKWMKNKI